MAKKFKLKETGDCSYSKSERKVFAMLGISRKTSTELIDKFYNGSKQSINSRKIIVGLLSSLKKKFIFNKEPFRLKSSELRGPHAMEYWLE